MLRINDSLTSYIEELSNFFNMLVNNIDDLIRNINCNINLSSSDISSDGNLYSDISFSLIIFFIASLILKIF